MPEIYFLSIDSKNVGATIRLNGAPIMVIKEGKSLMAERPISAWLMPGTNELSVEFETETELSQIDAKTKATIYLHDNESEFPKAKKIYASVVIPEEDDIVKGRRYFKKEVFNVDSVLPAKLWSMAPTVNTISDADKSEIIAVIKDLKFSMLSKDYDRAAKLQEYKIAEDALVEGKDPIKLIEAMRGSYQWMGEQPGLMGMELNEDEVRFELIAGGKVVHVSSGDGGSPLHLKAGKMNFEIPIYVSRINDRWILVR